MGGPVKHFFGFSCFCLVFWAAVTDGPRAWAGDLRQDAGQIEKNRDRWNKFSPEEKEKVLRNYERWPRPRPDLDAEIADAQKQAVTNLFPFPEIEWKRQSGSTGEIYLLSVVRRTPPYLTQEQLSELYAPGKAIKKSYSRHLRKKYAKK